jgi:hypothetical protein
MAYLLVVVEFEEIFCFDVIVGPHYVPFLGFSGSFYHPPEFLHHDLDHVIVSFLIRDLLLERLTTIS